MPVIRIGFDAKRLFNNFTGLGNYSRNLVSQMLQMYPEHNYSLYTPRIREHSATEDFLQNKAFSVVESKARFKAYWRSFSIGNQLKTDSIDLYHGLSNEIPFGLQNSQVKTVVTIHDLIFKVLPDTYPYIDRKIYDWKCRKSCREADLIIAISENTKKDIIRFYNIEPEKIHVIYQSVDASYWQATDKSSASVFQKHSIPGEYLLYVGSVEKRKNLSVILDAMTLLPKDLSLPLVVVGKGKAYKEKMQQKVTDLKLKKRVIWLDNLENNSQLRTLYQRAKALIYPSFYEGFGLPVVEALLCKTPVITSDCSSLPEAGGPNSMYIDPEDTERLSVAISKTLTDREAVEKMVQKGFEYAQLHFNPEKVTKQIMECYQELIVENP